MRMLTSEARIDAHRFRSGFLNEKDYGRLSHALGTLAEARVFIDDTASHRRARDARQGAPAQGGARPASPDHRLHPADAGARPVREPAGGDGVDLALAEGAGEGAERADRRAVAAVARVRNALRSSSAALRPARIRRARAGRRRRDVHLPRGAVPRRRRPAEPGRPKAWPRSSSASSATARSVPRSWRSSRNTRGSRTSRTGRREAPRGRPSESTQAPGEPPSVTRPTVARVDLELRSVSNFRSRSPPSSRHGRDPPRSHRRRQSERLRPRRGEVGLALEHAGAAMLACADIEEGIVLRRAGVRVPILVFGALGVSDLDGVFAALPDADHLDAALCRARSCQAGSRRARHGERSCKLPSEDRYRHESSRFPPRQPGADAAGGRGQPESRDRRRLHALRHRRRARAPGVRRAARAVRAGARGAAGALGITPRYRHAANSAALLRDERVWYDFVRPGLLLYGIVPPPLAATLPLRPALSLHSRIVHVKGIRPGEGIGYGLQTVVDRPQRSRWSPPVTPMASIAALAGRGVHAGARPARARRRIGVHGHDHDRRHRHWTCRTGRRSRDHRRAGRRSRSACAKSPRRSARFRTSYSVASARIERRITAVADSLASGLK